MTTLPNCLLIVTAEVDAAVEADWNRWYDDVHLPDALACPGVLAGRRYLTSGEVSESDRGQGRRTKTKLYTTVYELASPAAVETKEFNAMRGWARFAERPLADTGGRAGDRLTAGHGLPDRRLPAGLMSHEPAGGRRSGREDAQPRSRRRIMPACKSRKS